VPVAVGPAPAVVARESAAVAAQQGQGRAVGQVARRASAMRGRLVAQRPGLVASAPRGRDLVARLGLLTRWREERGSVRQQLAVARCLALVITQGPGWQHDARIV
jgi:hypothetical protein